MLEQIIPILKERISDMFIKDSTGHDIYHLERTMKVALDIQAIEGGDHLIIGIAAYLHDIHRILSTVMGTYCYPKDSLLTVRKLLDGLNLSDEQINKICHCIEYHEEYNFNKNNNQVSDIETLILQDADNLDAIGAIGIARTFTFGGAHNRPIYDPNTPLPINEEYHEEDAIEASSIHHFYNKLFKIKDNMNTKTGYELACEREKFVKTYTDNFLSEWNGKRY